MVGKDRSLVSRAQAGDLRAFEKLVERHRRRVYNLAYRMTCAQEEADDIMQETFVRAYGNLRRFDPSRPFANWLYTITINLCYDRQRRWQRERQVTGTRVDDPACEWAASASPGPDREVEIGELRERITGAITRLPARQRAAVVLFEVEGLKITQVADLMECSVGAVKSTLHRARRRLREELRAYIEEGSRIP